MKIVLGRDLWCLIFFIVFFFYSEHIIKKLLQPVSKIHLLVTAFLIFTEGKKN